MLPGSSAWWVLSKNLFSSKRSTAKGLLPIAVVEGFGPIMSKNLEIFIGVVEVGNGHFSGLFFGVLIFLKTL